jgi:tripartite-type tricarboxylate transporter receptor subunit TctC
MRRHLIAALGLVASSTLACAQDWPTRPVTMIVPYAAGGPVDTVGRIMAQGLTEVLGQQVIVENVGGAGGMTGANRVAKAAPDGYTFLLGGTATMTTVPALYGAKTPYNPLTDFEHVNQFADSARLLVARKDFPASSLKEFVAYAKANHDKMQYGAPAPARARISARCCSTSRWA